MKEGMVYVLASSIQRKSTLKEEEREGEAERTSGNGKEVQPMEIKGEKEARRGTMAERKKRRTMV